MIARKMLRIAFHSFLDNRENQRDLIIRSFFFFTIIAIFSSLWQTTFMSPQVSMRAWKWEDMVWYLAITETIVLSVPMIQIEIEADIRSGNIATHLTHPISYYAMRLSEGVGTLLFRYSSLVIIGTLYCSLLCRGTIPHPAVLGAAYFLGLLAALVMLLFQLLIGIAAFRIQDCTPLFWLWQRCSFIFGGMLLPLDVYPESLRVVASFMPFSALVYKPAYTLLQGSLAHAMLNMGEILTWGMVALVAGASLYRKCLRTVLVFGG